jgi:hypothetical protein
MRLQLASLVLLPLVNFLGFWACSSLVVSFSYDDLLSLCRLGLRCPIQDLLSLELDQVHVNLERIFVEHHLRILSKFQSSFVYG